MTDLDERLHEHFDDARRAELPPGGFERLTSRLGTPAGRSVLPIVALAAAVVVVAGIVSVVALDRRDGDQVVRSTDDPTTPPTSVTTALGRDAAPATFAAVVDPDGDGMGDVVVLDARTGAVTETLHRAPLLPPAGSEGGPSGAVDVDVSAQGVVYYEVCCEPAVGEVRGFDLGSGEDLGRITYGTAPAVSPDGTRLAVANGASSPVQIEVVDLESGTRAEVWPVPGEETLALTDLAWSPDGSSIAVESHRYVEDGAFAGVQVDLLDTRTGGFTPVTTGDDGVAMPAFRADGTLLVGSPAHEGADGGPITADRLVVWDPASGEVQEWGHGDPLRSLDATADGEWVVATSTGRPPYWGGGPSGDGALVAVDGAPEGIIAAGW